MELPSLSFFTVSLMSESQDQFVASLTLKAVEVLEDHLLFPGGYLLPLSALGMADRPWSRLTADVFV